MDVRRCTTLLLDKMKDRPPPMLSREGNVAVGSGLTQGMSMEARKLEAEDEKVGTAGDRGDPPKP